MSDDFISNITLEYLMNKHQYAKYILNKSNNDSNSGSNSGSNSNSNSISGSNSIRKDKKFYKKRIYDLTKQLINNEKPEGIYSGIIDTFELYAKICIEYFKTLDKTDIIQEDYNGLVERPVAGERGNSGDVSRMSLTDSSGVKVGSLQNTDEANKLMMRLVKITEPNSLEKLVKRTITKNVDAKPNIPPKQKEINLKDPILKNKGIRKKKNITNKYDETKLPEK